MGKSVTLTIISNMTSNYGEGLGNIATVQKVFRNGKTYAIRSKESLKNAIMVESGFYDDLGVSVCKKAAQKEVSAKKNVANCRALEGGYMNTSGNTTKRNSSFYLTDAVSCEEFVNETRFHNNLYVAQKYAKDNGLDLQKKEEKCGLTPYQYEYDRELKAYSLTIDLDMIGVDENFGTEADKEEKYARVAALLDTVQHLSLIVKGNMDNAEPIFVVGGLVERKTHYFENVVKVEKSRLVISDELVSRVENGCAAGVMDGVCLENTEEIKEKLHAVSVTFFFGNLKKEVADYYEV